MTPPDFNALSDEGFRAKVREFFAEHYPPHLRFVLRRARLADMMDWYLTLSRHGWIAPNWPREYGGMGLDTGKMLILLEESERYGVSRVPDHGIVQVGPIIMKYGSAEQKKYYLPKILSGEHIWGQGYSEPNAGSDLASLMTSAVPDGSDFIVNGQKIWTTLAHDSTHLYTLVRTSKEGKKQEGISFLLFDMQSPGISTQPIRLISGYSPFTQTFFDNVQVPKENLVGELNKGWTIAKYLLTHERNMIGGMGTQRQTPLSQLAIKSIGLASGKLAEGTLRADIARFEMDAQAFALTMGRVMDEAKAGNETGAVSSMLKYYGTELNKRRAELAMSIAGSEGLKFDGQVQADIAPVWLRTKANSIEGGTSEVQLNIIAKNVLRLPGA